MDKVFLDLIQHPKQRFHSTFCARISISEVVLSTVIAFLQKSKLRAGTHILLHSIPVFNWKTQYFLLFHVKCR